jgi:FkbM family methyltransferase
MNIETWLKKPLLDEIHLLEHRDLALDIGANVGSWTETLSGLFRSVIAVEPDPRAYEKIKISNNVTLITKAVADKTEQRTLFYRPEPDQNSLLEIHPIGNAETRDLPHTEVKLVDCICLDDICSSTTADFVKIDIEGGETLALQGCKDLRLWRNTLFLIECHDTYKEVKKELERLNKQIIKIRHPINGAHPGHCWAIGKPS